MRRFISFILAAVLLASLAACSKDGSDTGGETQNSEGTTVQSGSSPQKEIGITYLNPWVGTDPRAKISNALIEEFNNANKGKYKVTLDGVPEYINMLNKLKTSVAAGEAPDIFIVCETIKNEDSWLKGQMADLTPYIDDEFKSYKPDSVWSDCTVNEKIQAVAYNDLTTGIYYNKSLFEKAGISTPIKTWDEFFADCEKLKSAGYTPLALETLEAWVPMLFYSAYVGSAEGPDFLTNLKDFNAPGFLEGARFLRKLKDYTTEDALGAPYQVAANNFIQEKAAMIANGPWMLSDMKKAEGFYDKVGLMQYPGIKEGAQIMVSGPSTKVCVASRNEGDKEKMKGAVEFLKYYNKPENIKRQIVESSEIIQSNNVTLTAEDKVDPMVMNFFTCLNTADYAVNNIRDSIQRSFGTSFPEDIGRLWQDELTPEQFVASLNQKVFSK